MKIGVLGTGMVGDAIASKLVALGHRVMMGSRDAANPKAIAWAKRVGVHASIGAFADAARFGELVFNCTNGANSIAALRSAGEENLSGKILIDVANILPPVAGHNEALGEQIQKTFPAAKVVKALNTVNCEVMVEPSKLSSTHAIFICGNDDNARTTVRELLETFGWRDVIDLGGISSARATEGYLPLWLELWKTLGTAQFNIAVVRS